MIGLGFLCEKKILGKLKKTKIFALACFVMKTHWLFLFTFQVKNLKTRWICCLYRLTQVTLCVCVKGFDRFIFHKTKNKNKKYFCKSCLQCFSSKNVLTEHKKVCLSINGAPSVRLEIGTIEFKHYFRQIPVPFKIYVGFECNLKTVESYEGSY